MTGQARSHEGNSMPAASARGRPRVGPGRLSAEDAAGLEDRLLDAAFAMFAERGFGDATMDQIAQRAGASTKTLYSRFASKAELLEAVVRRNVQRNITDHMARAAPLPLSDDIKPGDFLMTFGMQICLSLHEQGAALTRIMFAEAHRFPALRRLYRDTIGEAQRTMTSIFQQWRANGSLEFDGDAHLLATVCLSMMTDYVRIRETLGDPMSRAEIQDYVAVAVDLFLRACGGAGAQAPTKPRQRPGRRGGRS